MKIIPRPKPRNIPNHISPHCISYSFELFADDDAPDDARELVKVPAALDPKSHR